jgi:bacillithiol biosynthesis cysteine-adding enzyme BshC
VNLSSLPYNFVTSEKIAIDYFNHSRNLKESFPKHFREPTIRRLKVDRKELTIKLQEYNERLNPPEQVIQNIEYLSQSKTYAIITGQQPGIFSGPLYTIYKAISAIVACGRLSTENSRFVPIFWNASEDHDLPEVGSITVFNGNEPYEIRYTSTSNNIALSHVSLDKSELKRMIGLIEDTSPNSEFKAHLIREAKRIVQNASTIADFFSMFMIHILGELGLIMIEPQHLRDLMTPVFEQLISSPTECTRILNEEGSRLSKLGYSPKIHKKPSMCNFYILDDNGERRRVTYNGQFHVSEDVFSQRELLRLLKKAPSKFSANAVTRPITQDFVLPSFAYVAGPGEIAYLAQLKKVYDHFSLELPVIYPRFGATILEKKISKIISKYSTGIQELRNPERLLKKLARVNVDAIFSTLRSEVLKNVDDLTNQAMSIDEELADPCFLARGRILKTIDILENKITTKLKKNDFIARQQITKAYNNLFPLGNLQERQINILEYLMKYGKLFLKTVYGNFSEADYGQHKVIEC